MLLYVVCTAGEFVWNEGGVVQLPAPYIKLCDFFYNVHMGLSRTQIWGWDIVVLIQFA